MFTPHKEILTNQFKYGGAAIGSECFELNCLNYLKAFQKEMFDQCYHNATKVSFNDISISVLHLDHLLKEKTTLSRPKDLDDIEKLKELSKGKMINFRVRKIKTLEV